MHQALASYGLKLPANTRPRLGHCTLSLLGRNQAGPVTLLPERRYLIGRSPDCQIVLTDPSVSRVHAVITVQASGKLVFVDLTSRNGSRVNHRRVMPETPLVLTDGDELRIGKATHLLVEVERADESAWPMEFREATEWDIETGVANRPAALAYITRQVAVCAAQGTPCSLLEFQIKDLDGIEQRHGRDAGIYVRSKIARAVELVLNANEQIGTLGRNRFVIVLPHWDGERAEKLAANLIAMVSKGKFLYEGNSLEPMLETKVVAGGDTLA